MINSTKLFNFYNWLISLKIGKFRWNSQVINHRASSILNLVIGRSIYTKQKIDNLMINKLVYLLLQYVTTFVNKKNYL